MGILLRSVVIIGAIVYLAPLRYGQQPTLPKPISLPSAGEAGALWQKLPPQAQQAVTEELGKQLGAAARRVAVPDNDRMPSPSPDQYRQKAP